MVKLYEGGAYLYTVLRVIADAPDALAAVKARQVLRQQKKLLQRDNGLWDLKCA